MSSHTCTSMKAQRAIVSYRCYCRTKPGHLSWTTHKPAAGIWYRFRSRRANDQQKQQQQRKPHNRKQHSISSTTRTAASPSGPAGLMTTGNGGLPWSRSAINNCSKSQKKKNGRKRHTGACAATNSNHGRLRGGKGYGYKKEAKGRQLVEWRAGREDAA